MKTPVFVTHSDWLQPSLVASK